MPMLAFCFAQQRLIYHGDCLNSRPTLPHHCVKLGKMNSFLVYSNVIQLFGSFKQGTLLKAVTGDR